MKRPSAEIESGLWAQGAGEATSLLDPRERNLVGFLAEEQIRPITRKRWFSEEYVRLGDYVRRAQFLFEAGTVLGYLFRERLQAFAEVLDDPGRKDEILTALARFGAAQAAAAPAEPHDLLDLFFKPEVERRLKRLREEGRTKRSSWLDFPKAERMKMPQSEMRSALGEAFWTGIGFGGAHPELVEVLFSQTPDAETVRCFGGRKGKGQDLDLIAKPKPLDVREAEAKTLILPYLESVRPDLLARLGLWPENGFDVRLRLRALRARMHPARAPETS